MELTLKMVAEICLGGWYISAQQHGITSQETLFLVLISTQTSHLVVLYVVMTRQSEALPNTTVSTANPVCTVWVPAVFNYLSWQITEDCH